MAVKNDRVCFKAVYLPALKNLMVDKLTRQPGVAGLSGIEGSSEDSGSGLHALYNSVI